MKVQRSDEADEERRRIREVEALELIARTLGAIEEHLAVLAGRDTGKARE